MRSRTRILVVLIGVGLATLITAPAADADGGSVVCELLDDTTPAQVSCTVAGPEGSAFVLVLASTDAQGSEQVTSSSKRSSGDSVTFTQLVPEGAARVIATGIVDGAEVGSALILVPRLRVDDSVALGLPDITVAIVAFAALASGAILLYLDARKRAVERRRSGSNQGVSP